MRTPLDLFEVRNQSLGNATAQDDVIDRLLTGPERELVPLLQAIQAEFGFLPRDVLARLARGAGIPLSRVYGVATFYSGFHFEPRGKHVIRVCHGTACHVRGSPRITEELSRALGVESGGTTTDRKFTLERVACVGCCSLAPVVVVGKRTFGRLDPRKAVKVVEQVGRAAR